MTNKRAGQAGFQPSACVSVFPWAALWPPPPSRRCQGRHFWFFMQHVQVARPLGYRNSWCVLAFQFVHISFLRMLILLQNVWKSPWHWLSLFTHISLSIELFSREVCSYFIDIIWGVILLLFPEHLFKENNISFCVVWFVFLSFIPEPLSILLLFSWEAAELWRLSDLLPVIEGRSSRWETTSRNHSC